MCTGTLILSTRMTDKKKKVSQYQSITVVFLKLNKFVSNLQ